jgi:hypothetical protein
MPLFVGPYTTGAADPALRGALPDRLRFVAGFDGWCEFGGEIKGDHFMSQMQIRVRRVFVDQEIIALVASAQCSQWSRR